MGIPVLETHGGKVLRRKLEEAGGKVLRRKLEEAGGSEGSRQGLKGRRVERWAHQESRIGLIPGRALAGEWHHREVLP